MNTLKTPENAKAGQHAKNPAYGPSKKDLEKTKTAPNPGLKSGVSDRAVFGIENCAPKCVVLNQAQSPINTLQEKVKELTNLLQRVQADFENYQKRVERERKEFICFANENIIRELLIVVDDFEKALPATKDEGFKMIYTKLIKMLHKYSVKPVPAKGEKFDAFKHEVLCTAKTNECPEGTILDEIQKGYEMNGRIIRYAKVKVAKAPESGTECVKPLINDKLPDNGGLKNG